MNVEFKMPDLATTDSEIKVIRWLVAAGESVKRGQALLEVETDKAMMEVESIASGKLKIASVAVGDAIVAGQLIAVIETDSTTSSTVAPVSDRFVGDPTFPGLRREPSGTSPSETGATAAAKPAGGMFAKNRAAAQAGNSVSDSIPLTATQRTVGRRMQESKQTIPHFYLQASLNAEPMIRQRTAAAPAKLAWDAFFAQAAARALKKFERMSRRLDLDQLKPAGNADIGVAVDHEGELYVVVLSDPATKTVPQISDELRAKVEKLRAGDQDIRKLRPAALTITNLGATRVEAFAAIVSPPEAAILAIGRVVEAAVAEGGKIIAQHRVTVTLSADHRVVNGKYAADFLSEIVRELENL
ncbi:MAG: pdhC 1 [Verrucomicrobia bacterium]|nr:pdhC 1 [Verrucomicrobiota bacterium]